MLALAGIAIIFLAVMGGFILERGNPYLLLQPPEILIIAGAAAGISLIANPPRVIGKIVNCSLSVLRDPPLNRARLLRYLLMLYEIFGYGQRAGAVGLEGDVENPQASRIFSKYPEFLRDAGARDFLCDTLRMLVIGGTNASELDHLMDLDVDVQRRADREPAAALGLIADSLPGLGIVAAVLGVVITMGAIGSAPEQVGQKVAAALVGTFIGILLCYGLAGPLAARIDTHMEERAQFLEMLRTAVGAYARGAAPILAVEFARRSIPVDLRPGFDEVEKLIRREARIPPLPEPTLGASA